MAKPAKTERQAKIDQIRSKQKGAERRRGFMIVGVCVVIALLILAYPIYGIVKDRLELREFEGLGLSEIGAPASVCQDIETKPAEGSNNHVPTDTPVTYAESPPAFGPHWNEPGVAPAPMERKLYMEDDRPALESLVHNLEHGYTVLWYDDTVAADDDAMQELRGLAAKFSDDDNFRNKFKAVPWTEADGEAFPDGQHIALTHWSVGGEGGGEQVGVWQYCSEMSGAALERFMLDYPYTDSPEPNAA